ncbi:MAG TPA: polysaccharide biosynthesis C-terminal domain-containing protein [Streptosporangiaceae bacterium]|nr:polysaccharide biosynthesis C-terminal domain-containing protein [Streptosporangiaceae bacterium]
MRIAIIPVVVVSIASTGVLFVVAEPVGHAILSGKATQGGVTSADVANALRGLAFMLPFAGLLNAFLGASRGYGDMRPSAWVGQIALTASRLVGVGLAVAIGSTVLIAPLWALPYLPCAVLAYLWGRRISHNHSNPYVPLPDVPPEVATLLSLATPVSPSRGQKPVPYRTQPRTSPAPTGRLAARRMAQNTTRGFWAFTTPRAIANTAQNILQQIDIVLVAGMKGPVEAAVYTAATRFLVLGQLGGMAINRASQTRFTELFTLGDRKGANTIYRVTTGWFVLLLWPMYLLAVIFGSEVLKIFGHNYQAGSLVIVILGLTMLLAAACGQVDMVLITSGRSSWSLVNGLLTMAVNIGVDLVLIPKYGITGAAIGWAVAIAISNVMPLIQLALVLGLHPFGRGTLVACVTCAISFGAIPFAIRLGLGDGPAGIAAAVIAGGTVQVMALRRFRGLLRLPSMSRLRPGGRNRRVEDPWN